MTNFKLPKFKAKVSTDSYGDLCADIVDKNNGNIIVACEVDEDYESFILTAPDMYAEIERDIKYIESQIKFKTENDEMLPILTKWRDSKLKLLAKARGDQDA